MTLPLIAVPCLAIFGLPSLGPAAAEAVTEPEMELGSAHDSVPPLNHSHLADSQQFPRFVDGSSGGGAPPARPADRSTIDPTADRRAAAANVGLGLDDLGAAPKDFAGYTRDREKFESVGRPASGATPSGTMTNGLTLDAILSRLMAIGIYDVRMSAGVSAGESHFSCAYHANGNETRRFEAEALNPQAAAQEVLAQVETWLRSQPAH